jgi:hypothetical protein
MTAGGVPLTDKEKQGPSLLAIVEMNLEEYPAFRLGRRSRRPELRYSRTRRGQDGGAIEQLWIVRGAEGVGLPGPLEQDLYVALLVLFTEQGLPADGRIRFTRNHVAQLMGISNSGRGYELIQQGLSRLAGASVHTEHAFYKPAALVGGSGQARERGLPAQRGGPAERLSLDFHILEEVRVYERRNRLILHDPASNTDGPPEARVDRAKPFEMSVARLGQPLVESYERRYTKPLDASFYFGLTRPLAKRLYRYVDKVRNGRGGFEIGLRALGDVLGLEYRYPSDIKDGLADAHEELHAHGFLSDARYAPMVAAGEKVIYAFDPSFELRGKRRLTPVQRPPAEMKDSSPLQLELESFGITPKRAAALVDEFSAEHVSARIEHVRARVKDRSAEPLHNPAGYLAKAISESFTVKESTPARAVAPPSPVVDIPVEIVPLLPDPEGIWGDLARDLRGRLSGATYAAFVAPVLHTASQPHERDSTGTLTLILPSPFAFEKWHRPPIRAALAEATAALGIELELQAPPAAGA